MAEAVNRSLLEQQGARPRTDVQTKLLAMARQLAGEPPMVDLTIEEEQGEL